MSEQRDRAFVRESIDRELSSLEGDPSLAQHVLAQANGKDVKIMKKKISVGFVLVVVLMLLMASAALAAGVGLFGELSAGSNADERLPELEKVAEPVSFTLVTDDQIVVEIGQAYYEGDRVFMSYRLSGPLAASVLHEGIPDWENITWDTELENFICAEQWESDYPEIQKANAWLDGKEQHWAETQVIGIHDGLYLADGTYADIIGGDQMLQEDGSIIGWKECEIPGDHQDDQLTFKAVLFRNHTVAWQDGTTYRASHTMGETTDVAFTLCRNEHCTSLRGSYTAADYQAAAELVQGRIDLRGTVTVKCPAVWVTQMNEWEEHDADMIDTWNLYQSGLLVSSMGTELISCADETTIVYYVLYPHMENTEGLTLVPVYMRGGEHMDEAIMIQTIEIK